LGAVGYSVCPHCQRWRPRRASLSLELAENNRANGAAAQHRRRDMVCGLVCRRTLHRGIGLRHCLLRLPSQREYQLERSRRGIQARPSAPLRHGDRRPRVAAASADSRRAAKDICHDEHLRRLSRTTCMVLHCVGRAPIDRIAAVLEARINAAMSANWVPKQAEHAVDTGVNRDSLRSASPSPPISDDIGKPRSTGIPGDAGSPHHRQTRPSPLVRCQFRCQKVTTSSVTQDPAHVECPHSAAVGL
jgi:hypothetical protein